MNKINFNELYELKDNNKFTNKEKKILDLSLIVENNKISEFGKSIYVEKSPTKFLYKSIEGLHVVPSSSSSSLLEGEIHYLPLYKGREIQDLSEVDKEDREKFMRNSLLKLIRAFYNFIEFIEKHPDTQVAKIQVFVGETFNEMAQLMKKELEINLTESNDPDLGIIYSFKISIQELKEGLEKFRRNHTEIYNRVKKSSLIKDNRIDFGKPKNF